jgi:hypothetical protein
MTVEFTMNAQVRSDLGKGASRRLSRQPSSSRNLRWRESSIDQPDR